MSSTPFASFTSFTPSTPSTSFTTPPPLFTPIPPTPFTAITTTMSSAPSTKTSTKAMTSESEKQRESHEMVELHKAKCVINEDGFIFNEDVLMEVCIGFVVRISMTLDDPPLNLWSHDAPYVEIVKSENGKLLGEVLDSDRDIDCNRYPIATGDKVWFELSNIIEIPIKDQSTKKSKLIKKHLTKDTVPITGPLYTVDYVDYLSDSYSSVASYSDDEENV